MTTPKIKFTFHGVKVDGKLYPAFMSGTDDLARTHSNSGTGPAVCLSIKDDRLPEAAFKMLGAKNSTDSQSDYFDTDRFMVTPASPYWAEAAAAYIAKETAALARFEKRISKSDTAYDAKYAPGDLASDKARLEKFKRAVAHHRPRPYYAGAPAPGYPDTLVRTVAEGKDRWGHPYTITVEPAPGPDDGRIVRTVTEAGVVVGGGELDEVPDWAKGIV